MICFFCSTSIIFSQADNDQVEIKLACQNYLEGFYEGDTVKLKQALKPTLFKKGFWMSKKTGTYKNAGNMSYAEAIDFAADVKANEKFAKKDAPKGIEILDALDHIAAAKVTAYWGIDYILLSKDEGTWKIEEVIWQGPLGQKE